MFGQPYSIETLALFSAILPLFTNSVPGVCRVDIPEITLHMSMALSNMRLCVLHLIIGFYFPLKSGPFLIKHGRVNKTTQYFTFIRYSIRKKAIIR